MLPNSKTIGLEKYVFDTAIFLYSAFFKCFTLIRSMTVAIETQKLRSCPMH